VVGDAKATKEEYMTHGPYTGPLILSSDAAAKVLLTSEATLLGSVLQPG
jgi:hypothetical protein